MREVQITTEEEFLALDPNRGRLVLFTAPTWCVPCRRFEPHWNKAQENDAIDYVEFVKVDLGERPEDTLDHWASKRFNILSVPTVLFFEPGREPKVIEARTVVALVKELTSP